MIDPPVPSFAPLLRIPPFPGSRPKPLVFANPVHQTTSNDELDMALAAVARARVGGNYWGLQPPIPQAPYILVRVRDKNVRLRLVHELSRARPVVCWIDTNLDKTASDNPKVTFVTGCCDPWHLVGGATEVLADQDDELALVAALAGVPVRGPQPNVPNGTEPCDPRKILQERLIGHFSYASPFTGEAMSLTEAVDLCAFWRRLIDANRPVSSAVGFASWKEATVAPLLWGGTSVTFAARPRGVTKGDEIFAWKSRVAPKTLARLERDGAHLIEVEDGFIRSVGLGADCVPPLSLVVDRLGAYFDPSGVSELEQTLQHGDFPNELIERARRLRHLIVAKSISKYGSGQRTVERRATDRLHLLVPGQVEDDRSVQCGGGAVSSNLDLIRRARADAPTAYILYKPHPDVEAGHRIGSVPDELAAEYADEIVRDGPITSLIEMVDGVHVNTSLAGFEALMRNKPVTTHGVPFYAGWGLTRDLGEVPVRRTARRTLDELVAAALLIYPRYLDPVTGLPCTPEILIRRLAEGAGNRDLGALVALRRLQGFARRRLATLRAW